MGSKEIVLVGVDGSTQSLAAVKWAADRAVRTGCRLHLLCTYALASYSSATLDGGFSALDDEALKRGAQQVVDDASALAHKRGARHVSSSVEPGDPAGVLIEMTKEVDLVVVGSRGGGGFTDRLLGTVSSALPAHAHCPVVIVPKHTAGKKFTPVERIVVGVDGSEEPSSALRRSIDEAGIWDARLTVVSAVPIVTTTSMMNFAPQASDHSAVVKNVREGMDVAIEKALDGRSHRDIARHALDGSPASLLVEFSTAVDLVVVGTRARGGLAGVLLGSTSQTVIGHSTCPVMVVPSDHLGKVESVAAPDWGRR